MTICDQGMPANAELRIEVLNETNNRSMSTRTWIGSGCIEEIFRCSDLGAPDCGLAARLRLKVDSDNAITEIDETNNEKFIALTSCAGDKCNLPDLVAERLRRDAAGSTTTTVCNRGGSAITQGFSVSVSESPTYPGFTTCATPEGAVSETTPLVPGDCVQVEVPHGCDETLDPGCASLTDFYVVIDSEVQIVEADESNNRTPLVSFEDCAEVICERAIYGVVRLTSAVA